MAYFSFETQSKWINKKGKLRRSETQTDVNDLQFKCVEYRNEEFQEFQKSFKLNNCLKKKNKVEHAEPCVFEFLRSKVFHSINYANYINRNRKPSHWASQRAASFHSLPKGHSGNQSFIGFSRACGLEWMAAAKSLSVLSHNGRRANVQTQRPIERTLLF